MVSLNFLYSLRGNKCPNYKPISKKYKRKSCEWCEHLEKGNCKIYKEELDKHNKEVIQSYRKELEETLRKIKR